MPGVKAAAPPPSGDPVTVAHYRSRPDLSPPTISVDVATPTASPGSVFITPAAGPGQHGALVVDDRGEPIWFRPAAAGNAIHDFRVQQFRGRPVLTWWEGVVSNGEGQGEYVIADTSYRQVARLSAADGYDGDLHEFLLTTRGTALITVYSTTADLGASGTLTEGIVQELDVATGNLVFEWHSLQHVGNDESYRPGGDYFHINSIDVLDDGNLLVSARHTSAVYKIDRRSGEVIWRLGGKKSDFELGSGATFAYQHDARGHPSDRISIFDDGAYSLSEKVESVSRAITLQLDLQAMTADLVHADLNPQKQLTIAEGNAQLLPDGGMFVGWGTIPSFSEFSASGELRWDAQFVGNYTSYRAFRQPWTGMPVDRPAVAATRNADGSADVYVSWNGATEVSHWRVLAGASASALESKRTVPRDGFETVVRLASAPKLVAVSALDASGRVLGTSRTQQI